MKKSTVTIAGILLLFLVLIQPAIAEDPVIFQIISTYKSNQARFHAQHRGRNLTGEALVESIRADSLGTGSIFYIDLKSNDSRFTCSTINRDMAAEFNRYDLVQFAGKVDDVTFGKLSLVECKLAKITMQEYKLQNPTDELKVFDLVDKKCPSPIPSHLIWYRFDSQEYYDTLIDKTNRVIIKINRGAHSSDLEIFNMKKYSHTTINSNYSQNNKFNQLNEAKIYREIGGITPRTSCYFTQKIKAQDGFTCNITNEVAKCIWN